MHRKRINTSFTALCIAIPQTHHRPAFQLAPRQIVDLSPHSCAPTCSMRSKLSVLCVAYKFWANLHWLRRRGACERAKWSAFIWTNMCARAARLFDDCCCAALYANDTAHTRFECAMISSATISTYWSHYCAEQRQRTRPTLAGRIW